MSNKLARVSVQPSQFPSLLPAAASFPSFIQVWVTGVPRGGGGSNAGSAPAIGAVLQSLNLPFYGGRVLTEIAALVALWDGVAKEAGYGSMAATKGQAESSMA